MMSDESFLCGQKSIEEFITERVHSKVGKSVPINYTWQLTGSAHRPPQLAALRMELGTRKASFVVPRELCELCAQSVGDTTVLSSIEDSLRALLDSPAHG